MPTEMIDIETVHVSFLKNVFVKYRDKHLSKYSTRTGT